MEPKDLLLLHLPGVTLCTKLEFGLEKTNACIVLHHGGKVVDACMFLFGFRSLPC